ncbi:hypothetical protein BC937DRAFT_87883 [Endogone sp. FLAS-F59071]|nr:hypothetical protein BC937DRAFT_87883 [Endogone sp. FLAS-F59071]|eukprot:RUS19182.1 hypothetical protein BC937DRAFT_87883 [Endogone sp. FLAS-F59071]
MTSIFTYIPDGTLEHDFNNAGLPSGTYQFFEETRNHEQTHVQVLSSILGGDAVPACECDLNTRISMSFWLSPGPWRTLVCLDGAAATIVEKVYLTAAANMGRLLCNTCSNYQKEIYIATRLI